MMICNGWKLAQYGTTFKMINFELQNFSTLPVTYKPPQNLEILVSFCPTVYFPN